VKVHNKYGVDISVSSYSSWDGTCWVPFGTYSVRADGGCTLISDALGVSSLGRLTG
jgi:hypothetical protein